MSDDAKKEGEGAPKNETKDNEEEELPMVDIKDPKESDVLCGRGGAALRHPGNQTYRRLVNLNKQLYITCLKTEKLKISRSIVAAIREQQGRFLERDAVKNTWNDIGDKKAIEKTSQALREGQPKLRQKMIATGAIPDDLQGVSIDQQLSNGMGGYPDPGMQQLPHTGNLADMPPPPARAASNGPGGIMDTSPDMLMSRLSLAGPVGSWAPSIPSSIPSFNSQMSAMSTLSNVRSFRSSMRDSGVADQLDVPDTNLSMMSDMYAYGGQMPDGHYNQEYDIGPVGYATHNHENQYHQSAEGGGPAPPPPPPAMSPMLDSPSLARRSDPRRQYAKMKRIRDSNSTGDGMPDFHMVDTHGKDGLSGLSSHSMRISGHGDSIATFSNHTMKESEHSIGIGSRRSLMSGLSKISDSSFSFNSDLSKKAGGSTRSLAMSEVSGVEEFSGDFQDSFNLDSK